MGSRFFNKRPNINPLMGWESSNDTLSELKLEFDTRSAIDYAKKKLNMKLNPKKKCCQKILR